MSRENVEIIRIVLDHFTRGEWDEALVYMEPDITWCSPQLGVVADRYEGHDGVRGFWGDVRDAFEGFTASLEEVIAEEDDRSVVSLRLAGRGRDSGVAVEMLIFQATTMRNGKAIRAEFFVAVEPALEAVGLSE